MFPYKLNTVTPQLKMIIYLTSDESASQKSMFLKNVCSTLSLWSRIKNISVPYKVSQLALQCGRSFCDQENGRIFFLCDKRSSDLSCSTKERGVISLQLYNDSLTEKIIIPRRASLQKNNKLFSYPYTRPYWPRSTILYAQT